MQPIAGPIYRYDGATVGSGAFPAYYDGAWLINNRGSNDGFWKEVRMRQDNNEMLRVHDWLPYNHAGAAATQQNGLVIGTQFGDDGALYMGRYPVGCCRNNTNASTRVQIIKVSFEVYEESTAPTTTVALDPATPGAGRTYAGPVTVNFTAQDTAGSGQIVSGIDYVEQRVTLNGAPGDWQRTTNVGTANPFTHVGSAQRARQLRGRVPRGRPWRQRRGDQVGRVHDLQPDEREQRRQGDGPEHARAVAHPGQLRRVRAGRGQPVHGHRHGDVTSTWPSASLTVRDATGNNTGRLVNGSAVLASTLQAVNSTGGNSNVGANRGHAQDLGRPGLEREQHA